MTVINVGGVLELSAVGVELVVLRGLLRGLSVVGEPVAGFAVGCWVVGQVAEGEGVCTVGLRLRRGRLQLLPRPACLLLLGDDGWTRPGTGHGRGRGEQGQLGGRGRGRAALGRVSGVALRHGSPRMCEVVPVGRARGAHLDAVEYVWVLFRDGSQQLGERLLLLQDGVAARVMVF